MTVGKYTQFDNMINTGLWKEMMLEMIINAIAPSPWLDGIKYKEYVSAFEYEVEQEINDVLLLFQFNRLYLTLKFTLYLTEFMSPRANRVCFLQGCEASTMFAVKGIFKQKPY